MNRTIEHKIRVNAIVIYIIAALIFAGTVVYIYYFREDVNEQKRKVYQYYNELTLANRLADKINIIQLEANSYVSTRRLNHFKAFKENLSEMENLVDSLNQLAQDTLQLRMLHEVKDLLRAKGDIVLKLSRQFNQSDYLDQVNEMKESYGQGLAGDSLLVVTTIKDTVTTEVSSRGFWKRLSDLFSSGKETVTTKSVWETDTLRIPKPDSLQIAEEAFGLAEQLGENYARRIGDIEKHVLQLVNADHEISARLTHSLMTFYNHIVHERLQEIKKSDEKATKNIAYSFFGGIVALALILVFIILIINDVNRGLSMRKILEDANRRIRQTLESRHRLLLSVSHDVKTPLNAILGYLELNKKDRKFSAEDMHAMENSGRHILSLLENLLHFSSLEQGSLQKEEHVFSLHVFCRDTQEMFLPLIRKKELDFHCEFPFRDGLFLKADELRIKQIVINLLSNATKYTREGSIGFRASCREGYLDFTIEDTGIGIPEEQMETVFQPFARIREHALVTEGSGFGLYVVRGLVELLGGEMSIRSRVGEGTSVFVRIPVTELESPESGTSPKRILIIDDDQSYLSMLHRMLLRLGHLPESRVVTAGYDIRDESLDRYDMVWTDMEMGAVSGIDIVNGVREKKNDLPVVVMTARADYDAEKANEEGFFALLKKPLGLPDMRQLLGACAWFDLQDLYEMFDDDQDAVREILRIFVSVTQENIGRLQKALETDSFTEAGNLCHKMWPMFQQIGEKEASLILEKIERYRSKRLPAFEGWQEDIRLLTDKSRELIVRIRKTYLEA